MIKKYKITKILKEKKNLETKLLDFNLLNDEMSPTHEIKLLAKI